MKRERFVGHRISLLLPWLLLALSLWLVFSQVERPAALVNVGVQWARVGALAIVMTAIILTGGIDLSVGSMIALSSIVMGMLWNAGWPAEVASVLAVLVGGAAGSVNGLLVVLGLSPLVATLATMAFYSGLALMLCGGEKITKLPAPAIDTSQVAGWPSEYWVLALVFAAAMLVVHGTRFGRWCYAIGDNPIAARFAALPVRRTQWWLYTASGLVAGLLAVAYTVRKGAIPDAHQGIELEAIACVVVGGTLITGGRGGIPQTLLGIVVIANIDIGLFFLSGRFKFIGAEARLMVVGVLLIVVAMWNEWLARSDDRLETRNEGAEQT
ncbi:MAG: ABC transporter permease [Planctomycetaceae bacterium]|nr:ABC transporter permease [Planctomycetaceae bacterium]MBP62359.1 ABC transporter permease [Planctomycetaceae bacterium]